jgi:uncharacterized protein YbjT (DUF2867 family)/tryptophan-rich sensory protein
MPAKVLITGASGYVGGRLLRRLSEGSIPVRCLARRPEFLSARIANDIEVVRGDVLDRESLVAGMAGVSSAYYFVHSMGSPDDFEAMDRQAAVNFAEAARETGVQRIIYLGGLAAEGEQLSPHLRSRLEVGQILRSTGVQVIEFRASIVIGSGSLSFELIRALVEKLPVMITPRWVAVPAQPIAIEDLLDYLVAGLHIKMNESRIYEIGGPDRVSYGQLMREYAKQRGLRRLLIPVPVLSPRLSSLWLGLVTPLYARIGRKLIDSIRHPSLVRDTSAMEDFDIRPVGYRAAIAAALRNEDREFAETRWSDAVSSVGAAISWAGVRFGNRLIDSRVAPSPVLPEQAFVPIRQIGGERGWYYADGLWKLRGLLDLLVGGVGLRRGRRDANLVCVGDAIDCWRVEAYEPDRHLRLMAEMRLPGRAWLEFEVQPMTGGSQVRQTAIFDPVGLGGLMYWYLVYPLHQMVFAGMLNAIVKAGCETADARAKPWQPSGARQVAWLLVLIAICLAAAGVGGALTSISVASWYPTLEKPSWTPPGWLFGPVWTVLYLLMACSAWLVWRRCGWNRSRTSLGLFGLQLALNVAWSAIFFGMRSPGFALLELLALWLAIAATTVSFWGKSTAAALLLTPYIAWTSFAGLLNLAIWRMNS